MKPMIEDMNELSDSIEIYRASPHRFILYSSYIILAVFVLFIFWMCFFQIDIVVKSNGIFRGEEFVYEISSGISGTIKELKVKEGQKVEVGDLLYSLEVEALEETIQACETELEAAKARVEILKAYEKSLEGDSTMLNSLDDNPYYQEFADKKELLFSEIEANTINVNGQKSTYQKSMSSITDTIAEYEVKKVKVVQAKEYVRTRENGFGAEDSYYSSIVQNYLKTYQLTASQYDAQVQEYERQIKECEASASVLEAEKARLQGELEATAMYLNSSANTASMMALSEESVSQNGVSGNGLVPNNAAQSLSKTLQQNLETVEASLSELQLKKENAGQKIGSLKNEKEQALAKLEAEQLASLEQQLETLENTITSLESNKTSTQIQLDALESQDTNTDREIRILVEKGNIASELLTYENQIKEYEQQLNNFDIQNNNCRITANAEGYFYGHKELKKGAYVQEGVSLGNIYPDKTKEFYAEVYVANTDIGNLKEGQEVKLEIPAYPSEEYGYFTGEISSIAKDISVDSGTGSAYYVVKVLCHNTVVSNKQGETGELMNGMACQAKIIINKQSVMQYLLKKIDLLD